MKKQTFLFSIFLMWLFRIGFAQQQIIGEFPDLKGSFESFAVDTFPKKVTAYTAATVYPTYNTSNTSGSQAGITTSATFIRSGSKSLYWNTTSSNINLFSSTINTSGTITNTSYTVQFYHKTLKGNNFAFGGSPESRQLLISLSPDGTSFFGTATNTQVIHGDSVFWTKHQYSVTSGNSINNPRYGVLKINTNGGGFQNGNDLVIDDLVIYAGLADNTPPNKPQTTVASSLTPPAINVGWDAPTGGVDNGGYVVVRTTTNPAITGIYPNQQGIYALGQSIGTGRVAYIGTATSFTDVSLAYGFTYYYLVFAVDKAFNYSIPDTASYLLPVSLTNFTAQKKANKNLLSWHTNTENNNHGFYIERSANGNTFTTLQFAPSKANGGNSSSSLHYTCTDELPLKGCNYYRLKQTDKDGKQVYSQTIMLKTDAQKTIELVNIFPSPASTFLQVQYQSDGAIPVYFTITDITGRILIQQQATATAGENTTQINVAMLRKGNYILKLSEAVNKPVATKKFCVK